MTENIFDQLSARITDPWVKGFLAGAVLALVVCIMAKEGFSLVGWIRSISVHRRVRKEQREDEERADAKKKTERAERKQNAVRLSDLRGKNRDFHR